MLVEYGADIETKNTTGWTSLMAMQAYGQSIDSHLERGAALCTHPRNAFDLRDGSGALDRYDARRYPCEKGWYLRGGARCKGLTRCPAGSYCPGYLEGTNKRFPCPAGTWSARAGLVSAEQCTPCPPERPHSPPGSSSASQCGDGTVRPPHAAQKSGDIVQSIK